MSLVGLIVKVNGNDENDHSYNVDLVDQVAQDFACTTHAGAHVCKYIVTAAGLVRDVSGASDGLHECADWNALSPV